MCSGVSSTARSTAGRAGWCRVRRPWRAGSAAARRGRRRPGRGRRRSSDAAPARSAAASPLPWRTPAAYISPYEQFDFLFTA
ncbi:hypothetical protein EJK15_40575 [Nonomuraea basaltis]|nr:hypothetical protein EJK15_40575 [Nonomuraea basaltis]